MVEEKKKFRIEHLIIVILLILVVYALFQISALKNQVESLELSLNNVSNSFSRNISSIYDNVDEKLREQTSLLSYMEYSYGAVNAEDKTVMLQMEIIPKEISEQMEVSLKIGEAEAKFVANGEKYKASLPIYMFRQGEEPLTLHIKNGDTIKTEHLYEVMVDHRWADYLPNLASDMGGDHTYSHQTKELKIDLDAMIQFCNINEGSNVKFENFYLTKYENGVMKNKEYITEEVKSSEEYEYDEFHLVRTEKHTFEGDVSNEEWLYCIEAVDSYGYTHQLEIYYWSGDEDGYLDHPVYGEVIYDKDGTILYDGRN